MSKLGKRLIESAKQILMETENYNTGLNVSRELLPQIPSYQHMNFIGCLKKEGIGSRRIEVSPLVLKPSQGEFNMDKIKKLISKDGPDIIISSDNYILDGHHRWAAVCRKKNETIGCIRIDMNIMDLIKKSLEWLKDNTPISQVITRSIKENKIMEHAGFEGTKELVLNRLRMTPGQENAQIPANDKNHKYLGKPQIKLTKRRKLQ